MFNVDLNYIFRWSDSILEGVSVRADAVFEVASIVMNAAFWFMKGSNTTYRLETGFSY